MNTWEDFINRETSKEYYEKIMNEIKKEYKNHKIFPKEKDIFRALKLTDYKDVKVVIIGQDPYHNDNQANGLAFSVQKGTKIPPSLKNIYKELEEDLGVKNNSGDLSKWAAQGVLLINAVLTVRAYSPASHKKIGWEKFTDELIIELNKREDPIIFVLWGNFAKNKKKLITNKKHYIIESTHPSPFSYYKGFKGSKPFSKINKILKENKKKSIFWQI